MMEQPGPLHIGEVTSNPSAATCLLCEQFRIHRGRWVTFSTLQDSTWRCITCSVLFRAVMTFAPHQMWQPNYLVTFSYPAEGCSIDLFTTSPGGIGQTVRRRIAVFGELDRSFTLGGQGFVPANRLTDSTASPQTWEVVKQWLERCTKEHKQLGCLLDSTQRPLPTRVLDLGPDNDLEADVKLYESKESEAGDYVCLSHCWGPYGCSSKTTTFNVESYKQNIPLGTLPRTFKEAVIFTRWLGIRYLWIDALSILQNSHEDWEQESGAMASIYEHSYLTLSALHASSDLEGLFVDRNRSGREYSLTDIRMFVREYISHAPFDGELEKRSHPGFPLLSRAWAFQERLLSPRVLHFGSDELYWECRGSTDCECHIKPVAVAGSKRRWANLIGCTPKAQAGSGLYHRFEAWKRLVESYTTLDLTFPTDRLLAILGLATRLGRTMPEVRYFDGLWESDPGALLWQVYQNRSSTMMLPFQEVDDNSVSYGHVAPTWSWAVVNQPVEYISLQPDNAVYHTVLAPSSNFTPSNSTSPTLHIEPDESFAGSRRFDSAVKSKMIVVEGPIEDCAWDPTYLKWAFPNRTEWTHSRPLWDRSKNSRQDKCLLRLADTSTEYLFLILGIIEHESVESIPLCRRLGLLRIWKNPFALADEPALHIRGEYPHSLGHRRDLFFRTKRVRII